MQIPSQGFAGKNSKVIFKAGKARRRVKYTPELTMQSKLGPLKAADYGAEAVTPEKNQSSFQAV